MHNPSEALSKNLNQEASGAAAPSEGARAGASAPPIPGPETGGQTTISPPVNVNADSPTPFKILGSGIDSLVLGIDITWKDDTFFSYLADLKEKAQANSQDWPGEIEAKGLGKWRFAVKPHGSEGYEWLLLSNEFALKIGNWINPKSRPSVMVEIRSEALWRMGVYECVAAISFLLRGAGAQSLLILPSRVDLCVDLLFPSENWFMDLLLYRVTKAHKSQVYMQHDRLTGFMIGSGAVAARLYDKAFEIERKSKKTWMYLVWNLPQVPEGFKVIRVEFQLRREALKSLGIILFRDLMEYQTNLWSYCTDRWLKFMDNPGKHTVTQREVLPWWAIVQAGFKGAQSATPLIRGTAFRKDRHRIFQQAQGLLSSLAALHFEDVGKPDYEPVEFNDLLMATFESVYRGKDGEQQTFKERVLKKRCRYQRLEEKSEAIRKLRTELGLPTGDR